ncbi:hypothetical protein [Luteolibacter marinus]|uniref:hypothetical protein n=1 Tax=Luteolibacter marinus TaxID=2776705 RepID=UPI0018668BAB|nr:hypothetical protein [Luteolibacter marinus]
MKTSTTLIAASASVAVALGIAILRSDPVESRDGNAGDLATVRGSTGDTMASPGTRPTTRLTRPPVDPESPAAKQLKLLCARGHAKELLVALERLSQSQDAREWQDVSEVLQQQITKEGRPDVAAYLLATGHGAPDGIGLQLYAAALDNPDDTIRESARLELLNLSGREFDSGEEARNWLASQPSSPNEGEFPDYE